MPKNFILTEGMNGAVYFVLVTNDGYAVLCSLLLIINKNGFSTLSDMALDSFIDEEIV